MAGQVPRDDSPFVSWKVRETSVIANFNGTAPRPASQPEIKAVMTTVRPMGKPTRAAARGLAPVAPRRSVTRQGLVVIGFHHKAASQNGALFGAHPGYQVRGNARLKGAERRK